MINFDFLLPTKIYFGKDKDKEIANILDSFSFKKVVIVIGQSSVKKSGLLDQTIRLLNEHKIKFQIIEGVRPNPTKDIVLQGVALTKAYKPDALLAIGGGSVIDTAKAIAVGHYYEGDPFDFNLHKAEPHKALPIGVILTISAAGSECSNSCVIQDDSINKKAGFNSELIRPVFAIENPELTYNVNNKQTANGIIDIMMHTLERYFCESTDNEFADYLAEGLLKAVIDAGQKAIDNPFDYEARSTLMLASSFSHNGLTGIGKHFSMPVHQLEHALSGRYPEVSHGEGLSILFPAWAKYYITYDLDKFDKLSRNVFNISNTSKEENARIGVAKLESFFSSLGSATYLEDLNLEDLDIEELSSIVTEDGTRVIGHHKKAMDKDVAVAIYNLAKERK